MRPTWRPLPNTASQAGIENLFDKAFTEHIERTDIDDPFSRQPVCGRAIAGAARTDPTLSRGVSVAA
jgi:hypothetical protein